MDIYTQFEAVVSRLGEVPALLYKRKSGRVSISFRELNDLAKRFASGLNKLGLGKGDCLGIMLNNQAEWVISDLAGLRLGAKTVSIPKNISKQGFWHIIDDSGIKVLVADKKELPLSPLERQRGIKIISIDDFWDYLEDEPKLPKFDINQEDIATICYTSGVSSLPKGVLLSHKNILYNVFNQPFEITSKDRTISYLPLSHIFERSCTYYAHILSGASIVLCPNPKKILDYAKEFKPTVMVAVPKIVERINRKLEEKKLAKLLIKIPVLRKIVGINLNKKLGGKLRFIVSGSASLEKELLRKFWKLGIKIYEGYGVTECAPIISANCEKEFRLGSVGKPIKGTKIKLENEKLWVTSPGLTKGYTDPELTSKRIKNGWFNPGDLGYLDKDGFLYIKGRADDWIVMSTGKKTLPEPIEKSLEKLEEVEQAYVFGENKSFLIALIYPNLGKQESKSKKKERLEKDIEKFNQELPQHERIGKFKLIEKPFTAENGLLSYTLKPKRRSIYQKYRDLIEELYKTSPQKR